MNVTLSTHKQVSTVPRQSLSRYVKRICDSAMEEPIIASGTALTIGALTAGVASTTSSDALTFLPICGIPAVLLFAYKIFFNKAHN